MSARYIILTINQGATFSRSIDLTDSSNNPLDLTGYAASAKIRKSFYSDDYVYTLTALITDPKTSGNIIISSTAAQTALMKPGRYVYTLNISIGATVERVLEGIIEVVPNADK